MLKKFHVIEFDKGIGKLIYKNFSISDKDSLTDNYIQIMMLTLHDNQDILKYAKYNKYISLGSQ